MKLPCVQCGTLVEATCANPAPFCPEGCKIVMRWHNKNNFNQHGVVFEGPGPNLCADQK